MRDQLIQRWHRLKARLRWPTRAEVVGIAPFAIPVLIVGVLVIRGADSADVPSLKAPEGVVLRDRGAVTPDDPSSLAEVDLASVDGTTTLPAPPASGAAVVRGSVQAPDGLLVGAMVRLERIVEAGEPQVFQVATGPDGRFEAGALPGGRYRARAFLPPLLAQVEPATFFLAADEQRDVDLRVERYGGVAMRAAVAPDPPVAGGLLNLVVLVTSGVVDIDGIVRASPVAGASVQLTATGQWQPATPQPTGFTDANGHATFTLTCRSAGPASILALLRVNTIDPPTQQALAVPDCVAPAPTTTASSSSSTSTTRPRGSTTTSTTTVLEEDDD